MSLDPAAPSPQSVDQRMSGKLAELDRRVAALERGTPLITFGNGAPGSSVTTPFYVDTGGLFLYVRVSAAAGYKRTAALV